MDNVIKLSDLIAYTNDQIEEAQEEKEATSTPSEKSYNSGEIMALRRLRRWATGAAVPLDKVKEDPQ